MIEEQSPQKVKRVYVRRNGRPMHQGRLDALESVFPRVEVLREILKEDGRLDPSMLFSCSTASPHPNLPPQGGKGLEGLLKSSPLTGEDLGGGDDSPITLHFEIGFGAGEHLHYIMRENPSHHFIGAEPYMNGMSAFIKELPTPTPTNIRVHADDALMVLNSLKDASIDYLYILNPDPWPKSRHHKRRIVSAYNLDIYARVMKPGGMMIQTTDVDDLAEWMLTKTINSPYFEWTAERPEDWKTAPNGWMSTRYENKGKDAGRSQTYLIYRRNEVAVAKGQGGAKPTTVQKAKIY